MKRALFITHMYVSRFLVATLLTYVYLANACPSCEGKLEKNSPAFFAQEVEQADEATLEGEEVSENKQELIKANQD